MSGFFCFRCRRALLFVLALLFAAVSASAQAEIRSLTEAIDGHAVGGVTVDLVGNIYVADFGDFVWKITPEGERQVFASGGVVDGVGEKAWLSFPNGIACDPWARRLYINESVNDSPESLPRRTIVRQIVLEAAK